MRHGRGVWGVGMGWMAGLPDVVGLSVPQSRAAHHSPGLVTANREFSQ